MIRVLIVLMLLVSGGCVKKGARPSNVLRYPIENDPPTLDWSLMHEHVSLEVAHVMHEGLLKHDRDLKVVPGIAKSWDVSTDGKVYTFHLREAKWSDGVPVAAEDFVFGWHRLLDPKNAAEYAYFLFDVENAFEFNSGRLNDFSQVGVKALDSRTLQVKLKYAASYFTHIPTFEITFPHRRDIVEAHPKDFTDPKFMRSTGPFRLTEWRHDSRLTLEPNPYYYGPKPKIEKVQFLVIKEDSTALSMYENGDLDVALRIPALALERVKSWSDYKSFPVLRGYYYGFNIKLKPFDNVLVRKAFAYSVDRTDLVKVVKGSKLPAKSWVPKGMFGFEDDIGLGTNVELARTLLAKAGYPGGKNFPPVTVMYDTLELNKMVAEKLQFVWSSTLGIKDIRLVPQEWKVYLDTLTHSAPQIFRMGWGADYPDPHNFLDLFTSRSGQNNTRWKNPQYDELVIEGARSQSLDNRRAIYRKAQTILLEEEAVIIPLFQQSIEMLVKPYLKDFLISPIEMPKIAEASLDGPA